MGFFTITRRVDDFTVSRNDGRMLTPNSACLHFSTAAVATDWIQHFYGSVDITVG